MPKVSIIVPVYNAKKFIKECLVNCMTQTLEDIEIIVVDDKSTDNTVEIVKAIMKEDSRIKLIELDTNHRQGYARNIAVEQAKSDYILFLDVDDAFTRDCAESLYNKIIADEADMTVCKFATIDDNTGKVDYKHEFQNYADLPKEFHNGFCYKDTKPIDIFDKCNVVWDKIYKKSFLIENNLKFPGGMFCEDDVFSFKAIFRAKKVTVLDRNLVFYRVNRQDSSSNLKDRTTFDCFAMYKMIKEDLMDQCIFFKLENAFMHYHIFSFLFFYKAVNKCYQKEFFDKMKKELSIYEGFLDNKYNMTSDPETYKVLNKILKNNYYTYEIYRFFKKLQNKNFRYSFLILMGIIAKYTSSHTLDILYS